MIDSGALERTQPQALPREFPGWIWRERELRTHSRARIVDTRTEGQTQGPRDPELESVPSGSTGGFLEEGTSTHQSLDLSARHTPQGRINTDLWIV